MSWCHSRLTVWGTKGEIKRFERSRWKEKLGAKYVEWLETSHHRVVHQFETDTPPVQKLAALSHRFPKLTFILVYEMEDEMQHGLAKVKRGVVDQYQTTR